MTKSHEINDRVVVLNPYGSNFERYEKGTIVRIVYESNIYIVKKDNSNYEAPFWRNEIELEELFK